MRTIGWATSLAIMVLTAETGFAQAKDCVHPLFLTDPGPYQTAIDAVMRGESKNDLTELRALYASQKSFNGSSRLANALPELIKAADQGGEAAVAAKCDVLALLVADFPLLETQYAAYRYYEELSPPDAAAMDFHISFFRAIRDVIMATKQDGSDGPVYTVLSVGEEYELLYALQMEFAGKQSLLEIDGKPYDRLETNKGPVFFDISIFFGREPGLE